MMQKRKLLYLAGAGIVLASALILFVLLVSGRDVRRPIMDAFEIRDAVKKGLSASEIEDLFEDLLGYRMEVGKKYEYNFREEINTDMEQKPMFQAGLKGKLDVHVVGETRETLDLVFQFHSLSITGVKSSQGGRPVQTYSLFMSINRYGQVRALRIKEAADDRKNLAVSTALGYLSALPRPGETPVERDLFRIRKSALGPYNIISSDLTGEYSATTRLGDEMTDPLRIEIEKKNYSGSNQPIQVIRSHTEVVWNLLKGYPQSKQVEEVLRTGGAPMVLNTRILMNFDLQGISESGLNQEFLREFVADAMPGSKIYEARPRYAYDADDAHVLSMDKVNEVLSRAQTDPIGKQTENFTALCVTLKAKPEYLPSYVHAASAYDSSSAAFRMIVGAVAFMGSPEAQAALRGLFTRTSDETGQGTIISSFTTMQEPVDKATVDFLRTLRARVQSEDLRSRLDMALSASLRNADEKTRAASGVRDAILGRWNSASDIDEKLHVLLMIANTGDLVFFPILQAAASDPGLAVEAVFAARFMESPVVDLFLLGKLAGGEPPVRNAAIRALQFQPWKESYLQPLKTCMAGDEAAEVRINCADYALGQHKHRQEITSYLKDLHVSDPAMKQYIEDL